MPMDQMTLEALKEYRDTVSRQIEANQQDYHMRYRDAPANYAASIHDDHNGSSEELARLYLLIGLIDLEIQCRYGLAAAGCSGCNRPDPLGADKMD